MPIKWKTAIITLSDKGYAGEREDKSGPLIREMIERAGYEVTEMVLLPDEQMMIEEKLTELCDERETDFDSYHRRDGIFTEGLHAGGNSCRGGKECAGNCRGDAVCLAADYPACHAEQGSLRDAGEDSDY